MFNEKKDQPPKLFCKRMFLKISQISQQNTVLDCVINKVASRPAIQIPTQVLFYQICEIFKNSYFEEYLRTSASEKCHTAGSHLQHA